VLVVLVDLQSECKMRCANRMEFGNTDICFWGARRISPVETAR